MDGEPLTIERAVPIVHSPWSVVVRGWLGDQDSNLDSQIQSLVSCRWTIPHQNRAADRRLERESNPRASEAYPGMRMRCKPIAQPSASGMSFSMSSRSTVFPPTTCWSMISSTSCTVTLPYHTPSG